MLGGSKTLGKLREGRLNASERGQVVVIVAGGMFIIVALVGLVIDGGFAWGQQRRTQNGADAMAQAGATVLAQQLKGATFTDGDVGCAIEEVADANGVANPSATYTDVYGDFLSPSVDVGPCAPGAGAAIPSGAQGVKAGGERTFETFLARVIGFEEFTASASATAVAGLITEICAAGEGCAVLPVTFPITTVVCDGTNQQMQIGPDYDLVQIADPTLPNYATAANESIIPLCTTGPGAVGWLDFACAPNLSDMISEPCNVSFPVPTWIQTKSGSTNALDVDLNAFAGPLLGVPDDSIVLIPLNNNTCNTNPDADEPEGSHDEDCPGNGDSSLNGSGNGSNFYYHIPKFTRFMVDRVYTSGSNPPECNSAPGTPLVGGNGSTGCFKGWFIQWVESGPVGPGATGPEDPGQVGVQLIR